MPIINQKKTSRENYKQQKYIHSINFQYMFFKL